MSSSIATNTATNTNTNSSVAVMSAAVAICTLGGAVVFWQRRKTENYVDDVGKPLLPPLPTAPIGSKFVSLPVSGITLRFTDTASSCSNNISSNGGDDDDGDGDGDGDDKNDANAKHKQQVTFLMLHGFLGVLETWDFLTPFLLVDNKGARTTNRVVALDMVGCGFSDKPIDGEFDYAYRSQGEIVSEFISVMGLSNVVIVGHSSGTVVGAATAVQKNTISSNNKDEDEKNVVVGAVFVAGALFRAKSEFYCKWWLKPIIRWMLFNITGNRKKSLERMHLPIHADRVLTDEFVENFASQTRLPNFHDALIGTVMAKEAPYEELVDELLSLPSSVTSSNKDDDHDHDHAPFPMLFVWGHQDTHEPLHGKQKESIRQKLDEMKLQEKIAVIETIELEECHHYPQHEQPEALAKEILGFVQNNVL